LIGAAIHALARSIRCDVMKRAVQKMRSRWRKTQRTCSLRR
jgi:hypothetical protein